MSLQELPMRAAIDMLGGYLFDAGWGSLKVDFRSASDGVFIVELEQTVEHWFANFPWDGASLDLDTVTAADFFARF